MAYGEVCKHCGYQEAAHDIAREIRYENRNVSNYLRDNISRTDALAKQFGEGDVPCESFESKTEHSPGCPVFIERNGRDYVCHDLEGGCEQLMRIRDYEEEPP